MTAPSSALRQVVEVIPIMSIKLLAPEKEESALTKAGELSCPSLAQLWTAWMLLPQVAK